jgi:ribosomal protein S18 acetylase RimI-like enzyme
MLLDARNPAFRLAGEADAETLLPLMREYYAFDRHAFDESLARGALLGLLRDPSRGRAWLILDGPTAVGYIVLTFGYSLEFLGRDAFLDEFYLRESYRGRGWGREILQLVEETARSFDVRAIHLEVTRHNTSALEFYRKQGFADHEHCLMTKWIERRFAKPASNRSAM